MNWSGPDVGKLIVAPVFVNPAPLPKNPSLFANEPGNFTANATLAQTLVIAGGGGGAGQAGFDAITTPHNAAGNGGNGLSSSISGTTAIYAGAVGGGTYDALGKFNTRSSTAPINLRSLPELQLFLGLGIELDIH